MANQYHAMATIQKWNLMLQTKVACIRQIILAMVKSRYSAGVLMMATEAVIALVNPFHRRRRANRLMKETLLKVKRPKRKRQRFYIDPASLDSLTALCHRISTNEILDDPTMEINGEIQNNRTESLDFVKVTATFYDVADSVIGSDFAYTDPDNLEPGQSAPFKLTAEFCDDLPVDEVASIKLHVAEDKYWISVGRGVVQNKRISEIYQDPIQT
jgi:hypothetical protein